MSTDLLYVTDENFTDKKAFEFTYLALDLDSMC